jgi:hypothetical protein
MEYRPLNTNADELRLITIFPSTQSDAPSSSCVKQKSLVHCTLDHCPLVRLCWPKDNISRHESILDWATKDPKAGSDSEEHGDDANGPSPSSKWRFDWGDFVALSYAWGDPADQKEIVVDRKRVQVQANLEAALRVLQFKTPIRTGYRIWIDALCINQGDHGEKSREVARMRLIYRLAADVIVWLGPEAEDSNSAMNLMHTLSTACKEGTDKTLGTALRHDPEYLGRGPWLALSRLLRRSYFSRMWVIQEICLGGSKVPMLCGQSTITWEIFFGSISTFGKDNIDVGLYRPRTADGGFDRVGAFHSHRKKIDLHQRRTSETGGERTGPTHVHVGSCTQIGRIESPGQSIRYSRVVGPYSIVASASGLQPFG